jgi:hypothetical protein
VTGAATHDTQREVGPVAKQRRVFAAKGGGSPHDE